MKIIFTNLNIIEEIDSEYVRVKLNWSEFDDRIISKELSLLFNSVFTSPLN